MRAVFRTGLLIALTLFSSSGLLAEQVVGVGAYNFPPYVDKAESPNPSGLLVDLIALANAEQKDYRFVLVPTSVTRRYRDLAKGRFDLILFESLQWGWQGTAFQSMPLKISDAEVYVARRQPGREQSYFDNLQDKRLALYYGFHYGFANFNASRDFLKANYQATLSYSHESNLNMVLRERADMTVVSRSYFSLYTDEYPEQAKQLFLSDKVDQVYHHYMLLRPDAAISAQALLKVQAQLEESGKWQALLARYHLELSPSAD